MLFRDHSLHRHGPTLHSNWACFRRSSDNIEASSFEPHWEPFTFSFAAGIRVWFLCSGPWTAVHNLHLCLYIPSLDFSCGVNFALLDGLTPLVCLTSFHFRRFRARVALFDFLRLRPPPTRSRCILLHIVFLTSPILRLPLHTDIHASSSLRFARSHPSVVPVAPHALVTEEVAFR